MNTHGKESTPSQVLNIIMQKDTQGAKRPTKPTLEVLPYFA